MPLPRSVLFGLIASGLVLTSPRPTHSAACDAPEFHAFDFMLGDWDVYDADAPATVTARNQETVMIGGCAIREVHQQPDGLLGEAITIYDRSRGVWHQTWVTNRGDLLLLEGGMVNGRMVLTAPTREADGTTSLIRGTWWVEGQTVRQLAERSKDGGMTWTRLWDIGFRRH